MIKIDNWIMQQLDAVVLWLYNRFGISKYTYLANVFVVATVLAVAINVVVGEWLTIGILCPIFGFIFWFQWLYYKIHTVQARNLKTLPRRNSVSGIIYRLFYLANSLFFSLAPANLEIQKSVHYELYRWIEGAFWVVWLLWLFTEDTFEPEQPRKKREKKAVKLLWTPSLIPVKS